MERVPTTFMDIARGASQTPMARLRRAISMTKETPQERGEYKIPMPFFKCLQGRDDE